MTSALPTLLRLPPLVRLTLVVALWIAVLVCCLIGLAYLTVLVVIATRRARRGYDLDRVRRAALAGWSDMSSGAPLPVASSTQVDGLCGSPTPWRSS
jgi:hypothetical protein